MNHFIPQALGGLLLLLMVLNLWYFLGDRQTEVSGREIRLAQHVAAVALLLAASTSCCLIWRVAQIFERLENIESKIEAIPAKGQARQPTFPRKPFAVYAAHSGRPLHSPVYTEGRSRFGISQSPPVAVCRWPASSICLVRACASTQQPDRPEFLTSSSTTNCGHPLKRLSGL